jgi:NAD(P)-dependent dehydrogenase (short-subunit alcohol dehydrogenase family)
VSDHALAGKVIVVTGSTRGIGRAIADECARQGATVVVCSRSESNVSEAVSDLDAEGLSCWGTPADVSSYDDTRRLMEAALSRYGRIDAWVNNAGVSMGYRYFDDLSAEEIARIVDINITGTMYACQLLIPYFAENSGILINMSGRGHRGEATPYTAAYAATKAAITSLTKSLAKENEGAPISIHALVPGMVDTDFYQDIEVSPRLESTSGNVRYALEAFGVSLADVGTETVRILEQEPGASTGKVYSLLTPARTARGIALMTWYRATGKMKPS